MDGTFWMYRAEDIDYDSDHGVVTITSLSLDKLSLYLGYDGPSEMKGLNKLIELRDTLTTVIDGRITDDGSEPE